MLLSLEKMAALLLMPAGLVWLLLIGAGALACRRRQRTQALLWLGAALGYALAGNVYLGAALTARLEARVAPMDLELVQPFDAVLVLGGGSEEDPMGRPQLGLAGDRIALAARLWHAGKARLLVASGCTLDGVHGLQDGGAETRALWLELGVPDSAILVVPEHCWVTRDEIAADRRLQERFGWRRIGLLSSAAHLPRALALAARAGLAVTPIGADWRGRQHVFQARFLVPQGEGFMDVQRACWEYLGRWIGR